jgi:hypothetical protein
MDTWITDTDTSTEISERFTWDSRANVELVARAREMTQLL